MVRSLISPRKPKGLLHTLICKAQPLQNSLHVIVNQRLPTINMRISTPRQFFSISKVRFNLPLTSHSCRLSYKFITSLPHRTLFFWLGKTAYHLIVMQVVKFKYAKLEIFKLDGTSDDMSSCVIFNIFFHFSYDLTQIKRVLKQRKIRDKKYD